MSRAIKQDIVALLESLEILHDFSAEPFAQRLLRACTQLMPETCHTFELWDQKTKEHQGALNVPYDPKDMEERFRLMGELVPREHPVLPHFAAGFTGPLRISDFLTQRQLRKLDMYDVIFKPAEVCHQVSMPLKNDTHLGGFTFSRGGRREFSDHELKLLSLFGRQVALAHQNDQILLAANFRQRAVSQTDFTSLRRLGLTRRECEVLTWMAEGKRDREIAVILGMSIRTAEHHARRILGKLSVETRTAAVAEARRRMGRD
ncbi:LuxR C-terminal-related transcriptional regulator [Prosthecobacter sp.]|uniref:helix-turn-helix transcriptional regulator n=1 Tax=Prosthecobacter sp. TaxID=1965333 RepID=UPI003784B6A9